MKTESQHVGGGVRERQDEAERNVKKNVPGGKTY